MRTNKHSIVDKIVNTADEFGFFWNDFVPAILQPIPKHGPIPGFPSSKFRLARHFWFSLAERLSSCAQEAGMVIISSPSPLKVRMFCSPE